MKKAALSGTAEREYEAVLSEAPEFAEVHINLGLIYQLEDRVQELMAQFRRFTRNSSDGLLLSALGGRYGEIAETDSEVVDVLAESIAQTEESTRQMGFRFYPIRYAGSQHGRSV